VVIVKQIIYSWDAENGMLSASKATTACASAVPDKAQTQTKDLKKSAKSSPSYR
jgi:hypothetical protein